MEQKLEIEAKILRKEIAKLKQNIQHENKARIEKKDNCRRDYMGITQTHEREEREEE